MSGAWSCQTRMQRACCTGTTGLLHRRKCECNGVCCCVYTSVRLVVVFIVVSLSVCVRSSTDSSVMSDWGAENPVVSAAAVRKSSRKRY